MGKDKDKDTDPFDELEIDESILATTDDSIATTYAPPPSIPKGTKLTLPAHIKRSHKQEEDTWHYQILVCAEDTLYLRCGSRRMADLKRNKLYNARTYLKYSENLRLRDPTHKSELDHWTLCVEEFKDGWYVVARNLKLDEWTTDKPE